MPPEIPPLGTATPPKLHVPSNGVNVVWPVESLYIPHLAAFHPTSYCYADS